MPRKGHKRVFCLIFLDLSSPRLASGLPGPPNDFRVKESTRLSGLQVPQNDPFPINRHARGAEKGFHGSEGEGIERRDKEEDERRGNKAKALPNHDYDQSLHCSLFGVLRATIGEFCF